MPRLAPSLVQCARRLDPLLVPLLQTCRDLRSAQNELRWLGEHVAKATDKLQHSSSLLRHYNTARANKWVLNLWRHKLLRGLCEQRRLGRPLQYILGSEYFGDLEIKCRAGVLIPRPETAEIVCLLASRLHTRWIMPERGDSLHDHTQLRVLDLCTGTGCITFLLQHKLHKHTRSNLGTKPIKVQCLGVDISQQAIELAQLNRYHLRADYPYIEHTSFARADVLKHRKSYASDKTPGLLELLRARQEVEWDVIIANPPYISPASYNSTTARSVRSYEPKKALVPSSEIEMLPKKDTDRADFFYKTILYHALILKTRLVVFEVGNDSEQANRVALLAKAMSAWQKVEVERVGNEEGLVAAVLCWRDAYD